MDFARIVLTVLYGIGNAHIVNAAFTYTNEAGSRFNDQTRGAWYAAEEVETSIAKWLITRQGGWPRW